MRMRLLGVVILLSSLTGGRAEWVTVKRVVDGDTFVTSDGTKVRVKGIDTPETKHPTKGVEPGGQQATQLGKSLLEGQTVYLEGKSTDKYGRRVAEVRLPYGASYGDAVKSQGLDKKSNPYLAPSGSASQPAIRSSSGVKRSGSSFTPAGTGGGAKSVRVSGYTRSDGRYVAPHYRSAPRSRK